MDLGNFGRGVAQGAATGFRAQDLLIQQAQRAAQLRAIEGQLHDQQAARAGQGGAYDAISQLFAGPGGTPVAAGPQIPTAPPPGQASVSAQPSINVNDAPGASAGDMAPGAPPGAGMPAGAMLRPGQPPQAMAPGGGAPPQAGSLSALVSVVDRAMPGAPPQAKMAALEKMSGLMNAQAQVQFAQMKHVFDMQMAMATHQQRYDIANQSSADRLEVANQRSDDRRDSDAQRSQDRALWREVATRGQDQKYGTGISTEDINTLAEAWAAGDRSATAGLPPGDRRAVLGRAAQIARGETAPAGASGEPAPQPGKGLAGNKIALQGEGQAARTTSGQAARIAIGGEELNEFAPLLLATSAKVDRTQFPTLNAAILAAERGTGGENVIEFINAIQAVKNAYAQVMTRGGQTTVYSQKRADEILNQAWSKGQIGAALNILQQEASAATRAAEKVTTRTRDRVAGTPTQPTAATRPVIPQGVPQSSIHSPSLNQWLDPATANIYDARGKVVGKATPAQVKMATGEGGGGDEDMGVSAGGGGPEVAPQVATSPPADVAPSPRPRVIIRGRDAPSEVDRVWGRGPAPGSSDAIMDEILRAKRGSGARDARR